MAWYLCLISFNSRSTCGPSGLSSRALWEMIGVT